MSDPPSLGAHLPEFETVFRHPSPLCYFHHTVDAEATSLDVEVIGPNLKTTFTHSRAKGIEKRSSLQTKLELKTVGFLALVTPAGKRVVLAWAESGHGTGPTGDFLDAGNGILENPLWTRRAIKIGSVLGLGMGSFYDRGNRSDPSQHVVGVFRASHVEIKLAVHAIYVLLAAFKITDSSAPVTQHHLQSLQHARWEDGSRPAFEIYFSRKYCRFCLSFVTRLEAMTGIGINLRWRHRLARYKYVVREDRRFYNMQRRAAVGRDVDVDMEEVVDLGELAPDEEITSDEETVYGDVTELEMVDLTREPFAHSEPITIDDESSLPRGDELLEIHDDPESSPSNHTESPKHDLDDYLDGLAYCVGQITQCPPIARTAILDLARKLLFRRRRTRSPSSRIYKPLPPTPETEAPGPSSSPLQQASAAYTKRRSPRPYSATSGERTSVGRRSFIRVEIPARRSA